VKYRRERERERGIGWRIEAISKYNMVAAEKGQKGGERSAEQETEGRRGKKGV